MKKQSKFFIIILYFFVFTFESTAEPIQNSLDLIDISFKNARVYTYKNSLIVSTGKIERKWEWTGTGFVTKSIKDLTSNREWCTQLPDYRSDWSFPGLIGSDSSKLVSITAKISDDDHFTSTHIEVSAEIHYNSKLAIRFIIWAYPGVPGIRTQLQAKALHGMDQTRAKISPSRNEYLPINWKNLDRRAIGYFNDTQNRNSGNLEILEEKLHTGSVLQPEQYDWASILAAEDGESGVMLVKESHKCVNQDGIFTGSFHVDSTGLSSTGWGLQAMDIIANRWRSSWANWLIVYSQNTPNHRGLAIKEFDRARYPINPDLDIYTMANTWGSGNKSEAAREENVLQEIAVQAELGIDVQQIDEGWQNAKGLPWTATTVWEPHTDRYPNGWDKVRRVAKENNLKLGIWFSVGNLNDEFQKNYGDNWYARNEDFKKAYDQGGFNYMKFDMANIKNYDELESLMNDARELVKYTNYDLRINWDVTENEPRMGYFFGRDLGSIYLANRKAMYKEEQVYVPYLVLRDIWQLSKYLNLNSFQIPIQNIDRINNNFSNANLYNHQYTVAIAMMGIPLFFQETHYYSDEARKQVKELLTIYKRERENMFKGFVFPIGQKPNDFSWTGFQNHNLNSDEGYILLFREVNNLEQECSISLHFFDKKSVQFTDLLNNNSFITNSGKNGSVKFRIEKKADFLYLKYSILSK